MSDNQNDNQTPPVSPTQVTPPIVTLPPEVAELVQKQVAEELKQIKSNLDNAYSARDAAEKKVKDFEAAAQAAEIAKMKEEGKHREAYELQLAEEKRLREAAESRAVELTRDISLKTALASKEFRSENAREMAFREIVGQLTKNADGVWNHKSGASVQEFVNSFSEKDDNAFLFKQKPSTGGGSAPIIPTDTTKKSSLFAMSQAEVLKLAAEGKLPHQQR